jgi:hypothetical protein
MFARFTLNSRHKMVSVVFWLGHSRSPIRQNFPPRTHIIVSRGTVDERNDGFARA